MAENQEINKSHYEEIYSRHSISNTLYWINNLDSFLYSATSTETSWFGMYNGNFRERLKGKKILEMGCGDCTNAAVMAALGAEVYANDIVLACGDIIGRLNENYKFDYPIVFIEGDFLKNDLKSADFDFVIGKAFLHHLTIPEEREYLKETGRLLKPNGEARFFEPAVNSKLLDTLRWYVPVNNRPSRFHKKAFRQWKENDPHPDRSFSSDHWEKAGKHYFEEVKIYPVGTLERFSQFMKWGQRREKFRKKALKAEKFLPDWFNKKFSRSQLIVYTSPKSYTK